MEGSCLGIYERCNVDLVGLGNMRFVKFLMHTLVDSMEDFINRIQSNPKKKSIVVHVGNIEETNVRDIGSWHRHVNRIQANPILYKYCLWTRLT